MHRLERNGRHFRRRLQAAELRVGQLRKALPHRLGVIRHAQRFLLPVAADFDHARAFRRTDPFDSSARKLHASGHVEQPVLETCRAEVGNQNLHWWLVASG